MSRIFDNLKHLKKTQQRRQRLIYTLLAVLLVFLILFFYWFISKSAFILVKNDTFEKVSWAVVLDGQGVALERSDYIKEQMLQHKVDSVVFLGRRVFKNKNNADFYVEEFLSDGKIDSGRVFLFHHNDPSTIEEARSLIPWLQQKNIDTVLLVTSAPATQRVHRIFSKLSGKTPVFITVDIQHYTFRAHRWIFERESRKEWLKGWLALLNSYIDLWGEKPIEVDKNKIPNVYSVKEKKFINSIEKPKKTPETKTPKIKVSPTEKDSIPMEQSPSTLDPLDKNTSKPEADTSSKNPDKQNPSSSHKTK